MKKTERTIVTCKHCTQQYSIKGRWPHLLAWFCSKPSCQAAGKTYDIESDDKLFAMHNQ